MKRKLYLVVSCALLSLASSTMVLQAMQEQELVEEKSVLTNPAARDKFYYDLIADLIRQNDPQEAIRVLQRGRQRGFDINYSGSSSGTLLNVALRNEDANIELINALIEAKADPNNSANVWGYTSLQTAIVNQNDPAIIQKLIKAGADVNRGTYTPLMLAVMHQKIPMIQALLRVPSIDLMVNRGGGTAYDMAQFFASRGRGGVGGKPFNTEILSILKPYYITLKGLGIEAVEKYRGKEISEEEIKQRLPQELQEELRKR
jgi:ankyrin repeat protein